VTANFTITFNKIERTATISTPHASDIPFGIMPSLEIRVDLNSSENGQRHNLYLRHYGKETGDILLFTTCHIERMVNVSVGFHQWFSQLLDFTQSFGFFYPLRPQFRTVAIP